MVNKLSVVIVFWLVSTSISAQQSFFVNSDNVKIHVRTFGKGNPILIINGGPGFSSEGFVPLAEEIAGMGYQAILFDQRGTGLSELSKLDSTTVTMDLMSDDIEAIRKYMKIDQWVILGHSFGGMMANFYASEYPESVEAMIHSSSGGIDLYLIEEAQNGVNEKLTQNEIDSMQHWRSVYRNTGDLEAKRKYTKIMAKAYVYNQNHVPTVAERLMQGDLELNRMVWEDMFRIHFDCKKELSSFTAPVLIIQGKQDVIPMELAFIADSVFQNSKVVLLDSCGHYGWLDREVTYFSRIKSFLNQLEKKRVEKVIEQYVRAVYDQDSTLIDQITDSELQKSGHYWLRKSKEWVYESMTKKQLEHTAATFNSKGWIPQWAPLDIEIYDINEKIAAAKLKAIWGFDYILLSKVDGYWKLDKILWQSFTEYEAKEYFTQVKKEWEKSQKL